MSESRRRFGVAFAVLLSAVMLGAGCNLLSDITSPSDTTTAATTTTSETFANSVGVQGSSRYTFTTTQSGTVTLTLSVLSPNVAVGLGIGTPSGTTACTLTSSVSSAVVSTTPQITLTEPAGTYCVSVYDVGNLTTTTTFSVLIGHP